MYKYLLLILLIPAISIARYNDSRFTALDTKADSIQDQVTQLESDVDLFGSPDSLYYPRESVLPGFELFLKDPKQSYRIAIVTDSTGVDGAWPEYFMRHVTNHLDESYTIKKYNWQWNEKTIAEDPDFTQIGTAGTTYSYSVLADEGGLLLTPYGMIPEGDVEVEMKVKLVDWSPTASHTLATTKIGTTACLQLRLQAINGDDSRLTLSWSTNNVDPFVAHQTFSLASIGGTTGVFNDGDTAWVKATLDVDNGAGGYTLQYFTSTDGTTWTQLGGDRIGDNPTSMPNEEEHGPWSTFYIGQDFQPGDILYDFKVRNGIGALQSLTPPLSEWRHSISDSPVIVKPAPEFILYNAAWSGGTTALWTDEYLRDMLPGYVDGIIYAMTHNDMHFVAPTRQVIQGTLKRKLEDINEAARGAPIVVMSENPIASWNEALRVERTPNFFAKQLAAAQQLGYKTLDVYSFMIDNGFDDTWTTDGLHVDGPYYSLWADFVFHSIYTPATKVP